MFLDEVADARLTYLRERNLGDVGDPENWRSGRIAALRKLRAAGYEAVGFAGPVGAMPAGHPWDQLPVDLLAVYRGARELTERTGDVLRIWEMVGEPDTHFCRDLPERVAAYQKALYLGLRDGARRWGKDREPVVLMGALGMFPGPWLESAARNGLFDYTDGLNIHYYGHARDFRDAVIAQRRFAAEFTGGLELPIWVTECGMGSVPDGDLEEARGREIQRDFTIETATVAREEGVAVFMPFILVGSADGSMSLIRKNGKPYPAWDAFAELTRAETLRPGPVAARPVDPNRIVVQWRPNNWTCIPHKVSGAYWFRGEFEDPSEIEGEWRVYNFSGAPVVGRLKLDPEAGLELSGEDGSEWEGRDIRVPAMGMRAVPVRVAAADGTFVRAVVRAEFVPTSERTGVRTSWAETALATRPTRRSLTAKLGVEGRRPVGDEFEWIWSPEPIADRSEAGPWVGVNGVSVSGVSQEVDDLGEFWCFDVVNDGRDPRLPPMAITKVDGLPGGAGAFLKLRFGDRSDRFWGVRVDLVDRIGQRFTVGENLGKNRFVSARADVYLAYADFHPYAFGRVGADPEFRPEDVREIQLRFYPPEGRAKFCVKLEVALPADQTRVASRRGGE